MADRVTIAIKEEKALKGIISAAKVIALLFPEIGELKVPTQSRYQDYLKVEQFETLEQFFGQVVRAMMVESTIAQLSKLEVGKGTNYEIMASYATGMGHELPKGLTRAKAIDQLNEWRRSMLMDAVASGDFDEIVAMQNDKWLGQELSESEGSPAAEVEGGEQPNAGTDTTANPTAS